jgi:hypothetical protein
MVAELNSLLNEALKYYGGNNQTANLTGLQSLSKTGSSASNASDATKGDTLSLSEPLKALKDMGVNLDGSSFGELDQSFNFNVQFSDEQIKDLTSTGSYNLDSQSLQADISFSSVLSVTDAKTGEVQKELFQFDFHLEASQVQIASGDQKAGKEDILQFARNMLQNLSQMQSGGKDINGLELNNDDLKGLGSGDAGKLLKGIKQVIQLLQGIDHSRGKSGNHGGHKSGKGESQAAGGGQLEEQSLDVSLSIQRVSEVLNTAGTGTPQTEDTSAQSSLEQQPTDPVTLSAA